MLLTVSALALAAMDPEHMHGHSPQLGKLTFETTCSPAAHALFHQGVAWLHSFEYQRAEQSFSEAAAADPRCGIADWGVAMSYYHPLWDGPTADELEKGKSAIETAKAAGAKSQRERDYVAALDVFYRDFDRLDLKTRAFAYSDAMGKLHERYPRDDEAAVFYALSLIAAGKMDGDPAFARQKQAGTILSQVLAKKPGPPRRRAFPDPRLRLPRSGRAGPARRASIREHRSGFGACAAHAIAHLYAARPVGGGDQLQPSFRGVRDRL
ncbi:MAG TPA: hypothetical protein VNS11_08840, partial [Sphingomicrobium sp.]|nr:hypothetical protein [Sphingomicrobium sp.]